MIKRILISALVLFGSLVHAQMFTPTVSDARDIRIMLRAFNSGDPTFDYDFYMEERRVRRANKKAIAEGREPQKLAPRFAPFLPYRVPGTYPHHYGSEGLVTWAQREIIESDFDAAPEMSDAKNAYYPYQYTPFEMEQMLAARMEWINNGRKGVEPFLPKIGPAASGISFPPTIDPTLREVFAGALYRRPGDRASSSNKSTAEYTYPPDYMVYLQTMFWKPTLDVLRAGIKRDFRMGREPQLAQNLSMGSKIPRPNLYPVVETIIAEERTFPKSPEKRKFSEVETLQSISDEARSRNPECARLAERYDRDRAWRGNNSIASRQQLNQMIRNNCF